MLAKRVIPCLDVKEGRVVKGVNFVGLQDAGDPVSLAAFYEETGADELVFLDINASAEERKIMLDVVRQVAESIFIPFTVGGGIRSVDDMRQMLKAGADKVSLNTAAVLAPELITEGATRFGSQCMVVAIDAKRKEAAEEGILPAWEIYTHGGRRPFDRDVIEWAREVERRGAGEILLTSIDADGTKSGFDLELYQAVTANVRIPVIASGGAGSLADFSAVLTTGNADAVLAASVFHYGQYTVNGIKDYLAARGVNVRI